MLQSLQNLFADGLFMPHGYCYLWKTGLVWLHVTSDTLIALSYYSIPITLMYFVRKRSDLPFKSILVLFGIFIVCCGTTHVLSVWTLWHSTYWLSGAIKAITALVSVYTAIALMPIIPKALALRSPAELEAANHQLKLAFEELANTQAQLIQSEKMSSLGQLVAGIAHEINNPVSFIYGNINYTYEYTQDLLKLISLYQQYYPHPAPEVQACAVEIDFIKQDLPKVLSSLQTGINRIRQIILSLRNFSRLDEADIKVVDLHEGIDSTLLILENRLKSKPDRPAIEVIKEYGNLPKVECYPGQLNQVFMNILNNAIDTLEESVVGCQLVSPSVKLGVRGYLTDSEQYERPDILTNHQLQIRIYTEVIDSNQVSIRIADNGCGMASEVKQKIFDPFFTTKEVGSGTGLGLSISYQIVDKHGGQLKCISSPRMGTEFIIQIPIHLKSA